MQGLNRRDRHGLGTKELWGMHSTTVHDFRPDITAFATGRSLWVGTANRDLVDNLRRTAQRRTRVRVWMRRSTSWI